MEEMLLEQDKSLDERENIQHLLKRVTAHRAAQPGLGQLAMGLHHVDVSPGLVVSGS